MNKAQGVSIKSLVLCGGLSLISANLQADDGINYDRYRLQASAQAEVENDQVTVHLTATHQAENSADVSNKINQDMNWAINLAKKIEGVDAKTQQYNIHPNYKKQKITAWTGRQVLQLTSTDTKKIGDLLKTLQERLPVTNMRYSPSFEAKNKAVNGLISKALEAYRHRANLITQSMGKSNYKVIELNIDTGQQGGGHVLYSAMPMVESARSMEAPALNSGTSDTKVTVSGFIELQ